MELREKFVGRLLQSPGRLGFTEIRFIHVPQVQVSSWVRLRCQYHCHQARQSDLSPPFSPTAADTREILDDYKYGLMVRREEEIPFSRDYQEVWRDFEKALLEAEHECFVRGYGKAFAVASGNCMFCHHDDSIRPCTYPEKSRPTLEAIGVNLHETLDMIAWEGYLVRDSGDPFSLFGLLLLE